MPQLTLSDRFNAAVKLLFSSEPVRDAGSVVTGLVPQQMTRRRPGTGDLLDLYSSHPWLRSIVHRIATDVASVHWRALVVRDERGQVVRDRKAQRLEHEQRKAHVRQLVDEDRIEEADESHPFNDFMERADPERTGKTITGRMRRQLLHAHIELTGDGFWLKERNAEEAPIMAWPIPPHWVETTPTPEDLFYTIKFRGWQGRVPASEMLWVSDLDPEAPYGRGVGFAESLGDELQADEYAARHVRHTFLNRARPDFIASIGGVRGAQDAQAPGETELRRLKSEWFSEHRSFWRAARPRLTNRIVNIEELGQTFRELQLSELRKDLRDTIRQVWGVSPEVLGITEDSNRATSFNSRLIYAERILVPRLELFRQVLQDMAEREYDERIVVEYDSPVPDDREFALDVLEAAPYAFSIDDVRELADRAPLEEGGDVHMVPFSLTPTEFGGDDGMSLDDVQGALETPQARKAVSVLEQAEGLEPAEARGLVGRLVQAGVEIGASGPRVLPRENGGPDHDGDGDGARLLRAGGRPPEATDADPAFARQRFVDEPADDEFWRLIHRIAERLFPQTRDDFLEAVRDVRGQVDLDALEDAIRADRFHAAMRALPMDALEDALGPGGRFDLEDQLRTGFVETGSAAADRLATQLGVEAISFEASNPRAVAWLRNNSLELVQGITDESQAAMRNLLEQALDEGLGTETTAQRIARELRDSIGLNRQQARSVENFRARLLDAGVDEDRIRRLVSNFREAKLRLRGRTIARTELLRASNAGQRELWGQAADEALIDRADAERQWIVTPDDRLDSDICLPMAGAAVPLDEPFVLPDRREVMDPQEAHPNCRCVEALIFQ